MSKIINYSQLFNLIYKNLGSQKKVIIAIDGPCASGKTTLANKIAGKLGGNVYHLDDFYLSHVQKKMADKTVPGWNSNRSRFIKEVLIPLKQKRPVSYRKYNCKTDCLELAHEIESSQLEIVEGVYSHHPELVSYYNLKLYLEAANNLRQQRLLKRNGKAGSMRFNTIWIPLENDYFDTFKIKYKSDYVIKTD